MVESVSFAELPTAICPIGSVAPAMSPVRSVISWPKRVDGSILAATFAFSLSAMALLAYFAIESADRRRALAILIYGALLLIAAPKPPS